MQNTISKIVDKHLERWMKHGLDRVGKGEVPSEMERLFCDIERGEEYTIWVPIPTHITDQELDQLEDTLGHPLPISYRHFLQYKHFQCLHIEELNIYNHTPNRWKTEAINRVYKGYPTEYLIDKGLVPFADYSDWGYLCFDTNQEALHNEYPIVLWDHDDPDNASPMFDSFVDMLLGLSKREDENIEE